MKNREIKFRAYESSWKRMFYSDAQDDARFLGAKLGGSLIATFFNHFYAHKTLSQFTGLKDKKGVDIYEGDILQIESDKLMVVSWSEKFASFVLNREGWMFSHWFGESCNPESCIIVGNIHENPELLNT